MQMGIFKKLNWFFKQEWKSYVVGVFFLIIVAILQVVSPRVVGIIIDEIAQGTLSRSSLMKWVLLILVSGILQYLFRYIWRMKIWGTSAELERILRSRLFKHFTEMDATFYQKFRTGDLMAHATNDLNAIRMVAGAGILTLADSISSGGITLFTMFFLIDWRLTLIAMIPLPGLTLVSRILGKRMHKSFRKAQAAFSDLNDKTQESVSGVKVIKTFGEEEQDIRDFEARTKDVMLKNKEVYRTDALFDPAIQLILGLSYALTIIFGGRFVVRRQHQHRTIGFLHQLHQHDDLADVGSRQIIQCAGKRERKLQPDRRAVERKIVDRREEKIVSEPHIRKPRFSS